MVHVRTDDVSASDEAILIARAVQKDETAIRAIITQHNRRLYRVARSVLKNDSEAEDVLQEAYVRAFASLGDFRGQSALSTWLTRIVLNEALSRLRRNPEVRSGPSLDDPARPPGKVIPFANYASQVIDPERAMAQNQIMQMLEAAIDHLPDDFRMVLIARVIEGMSVDETAKSFGLRPETVKTRLHRARVLLKAELADHIGPLVSDAFPFDGRRCKRLTELVIKRLRVPD